LSTDWTLKLVDSMNAWVRCFIKINHDQVYKTEIKYILQFKSEPIRIESNRKSLVRFTVLIKIKPDIKYSCNKEKDTDGRTVTKTCTISIDHCRNFV
jgi:hypothetical protein